ncbi:MAG TPA: CsbD family protein [Rhodospirillaceae bacterium]|nr:CsbD family protein [Rhodospirillaceae bacterium]
MNKDRIAGSAKQARGSLEVMAGEILGDAKLVADGKRDKKAGKIQNAIGGVKDAAKDARSKT